MGGKKRKVNSPLQEGPSDLCANLKDFIVKENAKSVKEIKDSNNRRLAALEDSLSFTMDPLTSVSARQKSTEQHIYSLEKETEELRRRVRRMEVAEDRLQQDRRLSTLLFSGPSLQSGQYRRHEDAMEWTLSVLREYLRRNIDRSQIKAFVMLKGGKLLVDFTSVAPGSERDVLFRSKVKLKGSGLFISESLTPRRQEMFQKLLQLKKEKKIFSVFTRSGNILVCRSRDSAPVRVLDPEAVSALSEPGVSRHPEQGRVEVENEGGQRPGGAVVEGERRGREQSVADESRQRPFHRDRVDSGTAVSHVRLDSGTDLHPDSSELESVGTSPGGEVSRRRPSVLRDCARDPVPETHLSPPLQEPRGAEAGVRPSDGVPPAPASLEPPVRPAAAAGADSPGTVPETGERLGLREEATGIRTDSGPPPGGPRRCGDSAREGAGGATGEIDRVGLEGGRMAGASSKVLLGGNNLVGSDRGFHRKGRSRERGARPRPHSLSEGLGSGRREGEASRSRDIREFF